MKDIDKQEDAVPSKYRKRGVCVRKVGDLKKALAELPDWLPIDRGFSTKPAKVVVTRVFSGKGDKLEFLLETDN